MLHTDRVVVLVDMDCFYCQVEEKLDPQLTGKPIAVVQYNAWKGGGIIAVNYPARDRGVTRHMRGDEAKEKCPEIELVRVPNVRGKADLSKYREGGKRVADVLKTFTPLLQRASVDEAYLDITESVNDIISTSQSKITVEDLKNTHVVGFETKVFIENIYNNHLFMDCNLKLIVGGVIVEKIRAEIYEKTGYKCSAGIAHNKILAKLACGMHKPNKQTILPQESVEELYKNLPLRKIKSLGGKFGVSLSEDLKITHMGELTKFSEHDLLKKYDEKTTMWLYNIARGIDLEPVTTRLVSKSIGCCKKFPGKSALRTVEDVMHWLNKLSAEITERLEQDLEENNRRAKSLTVSFAQEFNRKDINGSRALSLQSYDASRIVNDAFKLLKKNTQKKDGSFTIKLLGLSAGKFEKCNNVGNISNFFKVISKSNSQLQTVTLNKNEETCNTIVQNENNFPTNFDIVNDLVPEDNMDIHDDYSNSTVEMDYTEKLNEKLEYPYRFENNCELNFCAKFSLINSDELTACNSKGNHNPTTNNKDKTKPVLLKNPNKLTCVDESIVQNICNSEERNFYQNLNLDQVSGRVSPVINSNVGDTSKSFFMRYLKTLDMKTEQNQHQKMSSNSIVSFRNTGSPKKNCTECNAKVSVADYIAHMDHHIAMRLMEEERQSYQQQRAVEKTVLKSPAKNAKMQKTKSIKHKIEKTKNSLLSYLEPKMNATNFDTQLCPECDKHINVNEYSSHLDFHAAKKLHLELNPVKQTIKLANTKKYVNAISLTNYFKPLN